jgi:hypothetical protein
MELAQKGINKFWSLIFNKTLKIEMKSKTQILYFRFYY